MKKLTTKQFIKKSIKIHGNRYNYLKSDYKTNKKNVFIECLKHGMFSQRPNEHLKGSGCPMCASIQRPISKTLSQLEFIKKCKKIHGERYDYSKCVYKHNRRKIEVICKIHGSFMTTATDHRCGSGCPSCNFSRGESMVINWLNKNNIIFETQKKFEDCKNPKTNRKLPFDFYIPSYNVLVEIDGNQHYPEHIGRFIGKHRVSKDEYEQTKFRDGIKTLYANSKQVKLLRIPYITRKDIIPVLEKELL